MNRRTAQNAVGLAGRFATCPHVFDRETERIFSHSWICVGRVTDLESSGAMVAKIEQDRFLLVRGEDDRLRAFHNFCRHRGAALAAVDSCDRIGQRIQCPYHAWTYDRSGQLVSAPNMAGVESFDPDQFGLRQLECETWGGFVFLKREPGGDSLEKFLQPIHDRQHSCSLEQLVVVETIEYEVNANWKLIFQNYNECYHCPIVHPALNRLTPYKGATNDFESGPILGGPMSLADDCQTMSSSGRLVGKILPQLTNDQQRVVSYYTVFPTMFLSFHPDYVLVHLLERVSPSVTRVKCQFLFHPESTSSYFDPAEAVQFWDETNRQDWHVCELAQQGMSSSGYVPGPYSNLESVVAAFDRHYLEQLQIDLP